MLLAKSIVILFGIFLIIAGCLMLFDPQKIRSIIRKAGSTSFINYAELIIRMIPALGLIVFAMESRYPFVFKIVGWFMLISSVILMLIPKRMHHSYAIKAAEILKPKFCQVIAPLSFVFGGWFIYAVL